MLCGEEHRDRFPVSQTVGNDTQRKGLDGCERLLASAAVDHDSGERGDVGDPAPVGLAVELYF